MTDNAPVSRLRRCGAPVALLGVALLTACASPAPTPAPVRVAPDMDRVELIRPAAPSAPAPAAAGLVPPKAAAVVTPSAPVVPEDDTVAPEDDAVAPAPVAPDRPIDQGLASWYGPKFHGRRTASGERYDMHALTAAHKTLPFGTKVRVRSVHTGKEVVVRINDRGPYKHSRIIDLSLGAITALGARHRGVTEVVLLRE